MGIKRAQTIRPKGRHFAGCAKSAPRMRQLLEAKLKSGRFRKLPYSAFFSAGESAACSSLARAAARDLKYAPSGVFTSLARLS